VQAKAAAKEALVLNTQLQTIDKTVGQSQRNVGNYAGGIQKAFSGLRTLANILPGIGISGLFLAGFEALKFLVGELGLFNSKLFTITQQRQVLAKIGEEAAVSAGKEAGALKVLRAEIENTAVPMERRLQGIKDIKEEYPEYFKGLTNEQVLTGNVANAYDLATAAILRKAKAQAAATELQLIEGQKFAILQKSQAAKDLADEQIRKAESIESVDEFGRNIEIKKELVQREIRNRHNAQVKSDQKEMDELNKKEAFILKIITANGGEEIKLDKAKKEKKAAIVKDSTKAVLDSDFELYKIAQTEKIKLLDDEVKNEKNSFAKRIEALDEFSAEKQELAINQAIHDLQVQDNLDKVLAANEKKAKGRELENIKIERANIATKKKEILVKEAVDERAIEKENADQAAALAEKESADILARRKKHFEDEIKLIEENFNELKAARDSQYADDTTALQRSFDQGELSQRRFNRQRLKLEFDYARDSLLIAIDTAQKKIDLFDISDEDRAKAQAQLAQLEKKLSDASLDYTLKNEKLKRQAILDTLAQVKQMGDQVFSVIDGILNAGAIKQKNMLDAQGKANEEQAQKEIEAINRSGAAEQDKAAQITVINARLAAQKDQIARKEKEADLKKAAFDKAAAIFNIILSTAEAVMKAAPNIPLMVFTAAIGAAELATAIATPVPKYKHGKGVGDDYEGLAYVGDGGKSELIEHEDGSMEVTPAVPTLTHVKRKDIIYPDYIKLLHDTAQRDLSNSMRFTPAKNNVEDKINATLIKGFAGLSNTIRNKREITIKGVSGKDIIFRDGSNTTTYLNQNLQG